MQRTALRAAADAERCAQAQAHSNKPRQAFLSHDLEVP